MIGERRYLLTRCLRLEQRNGQLKRELSSLKREIAGIRPYRHRRSATPGEIAEMRTLRSQGLSPADIAERTGWERSTIWRHTRDLVIEREREVGAA